jgi:hypothetical protein
MEKRIRPTPGLRNLATLSTDLGQRDCVCSIFLGVDINIAILDEPNHGEIPWEAKGR